MRKVAMALILFCQASRTNCVCFVSSEKWASGSKHSLKTHLTYYMNSMPLIHWREVIIVYKCTSHSSTEKPSNCVELKGLLYIVDLTPELASIYLELVHPMSYEMNHQQTSEP